MKNQFIYFFTSLLLVLAQPVNSQVVCTDVNPDIVNTGNASLDIDVNNDNTPDFRLTSAQVGTLAFVVVQGSQIGTTNFVLTNGNGDALALPFGTPIGATSTTWTQMNSTNQTMVLIAGTTTLGAWGGINDHYLGLRFVVGSNTYYGWARLSFNGAFNTYTFKEYAYESNAGGQILAGQGCVSPGNPGIAVPSSTVCLGSTVTFTALTGTPPAPNYTWTILPAISPVNTPSNTVTFTFSNTSLYTITLTTNSGTVTGTATQTIVVVLPPSVSVTPANTTICQYSGTSLTVNGNATSYLWIPTVGLTSFSTAVTVASPTSTQIYTVQVGNNGCVVQHTAAVNVEVPPSHSVFIGSTSLCAQPFNGSPATVTIGLVSGPGYSLTGTNTSLLQLFQTPTTTTLQAVPPYPVVTTLATLTMQATNGICTTILPMGYQIVPNPSVNLTTPTATLCPGEQFTLNATGDGAYFWGWTGINGATLTPGSPGNAIVSATASTTFSVFTSGSGCFSDSKTASLTIKPAPHIIVADTILCSNYPVQLYAGGTGTISWYGVSGLIGTGSPLTHTLPLMTPAVYNFTVTADSIGCTSTAVIQATASICTSVGEFHVELNKPHIFPHPAKTEFTVEWSAGIETAEIFDIAGRLVMKRELELSGKSTLRVSLVPGHYTLRLSNRKGQSANRVLLLE